jgi:hypothetical protein
MRKISGEAGPSPAIQASTEAQPVLLTEVMLTFGAAEVAPMNRAAGNLVTANSGNASALT